MRTTCAVRLGLAVVVATGSACTPAGDPPDDGGPPTVTSAAPAGWAGTQPRTTEVLRVGSADDSATAFGRIADLAVDPHGRIHVLDAQARTVRVFGPDGRAVGSIGAAGLGPGELMGPTAVLFLADTMVVPDPGAGRISRWVEGEPAGSAPLDAKLAQYFGWEAAGGRLLAHRRRYGADKTAPTFDEVVAVAPTTGAVTSVAAFDEGAFGPPGASALAPAPRWAARADGALVFARTEEAGVRVLAADGTPVQRLVWARTAPEVSAADRAAYARMMADLIAAKGGGPDVASAFLAGVSFPERGPVLDRLLYDPAGRLWVQRAVPMTEVERLALPFDGQAAGGPVWDVFDGAGAWLGPVELPPRFTPHVWHGAVLYGALLDTLDVPHMVGLRVEGLPSAGAASGEGRD